MRGTGIECPTDRVVVSIQINFAGTTRDQFNGSHLNTGKYDHDNGDSMEKPHHLAARVSCLFRKTSHRVMAAVSTEHAHVLRKFGTERAEIAGQGVAAVQNGMEFLKG